MKTHYIKSVLIFLCFFSIANAQQINPILQFSKAKLGLSKLEKPIFHFYYNEVGLGREQSDRSYAPFFSQATNAEAWFYPQINATRVAQTGMRVGSGPSTKPSILFYGVAKSYFARDTTYVPVPYEYDKQNPWAVLIDWADDVSVKQVKNEFYRDYDRLVFERPTEVGKERLFIDPKTYFPIKLDYYELSSLWGQQYIEIVYSNWKVTQNAFYPNATFRLEDGEPMVYRTLGKSNLSDSVSLFTRFQALKTTGAKNSSLNWYKSEQPELVKVSEQTYLSKNRMYTETFTKIDNTIYLLDATLSEERAKQDEKLIKQAFPGIKNIVVVVTDLAWPHIGGVRYWVSKGATIVSHTASQKFLEKVVNRKWILKPDELQRNPKKMKFIAVNKLTDMANGKLKIFPIDGIGSEGALACYLENDQLLWASDYIQSVQLPTAYAKEVIAAVNRENLKPIKVVAQHIALSDWQKVVKINE